MRLKLGVLIIAGVLFAAGGARADCCNIFDIAQGACNVVGCNCDGPCSNFGASCKNGPTSMDDMKGYCPGYTWCESGGFCGPGTHCANYGGKAYCFADSLAQSKAQPTPARTAVNISRAVTTTAAAERFREIDANHDGHLSFDEVKAWAAKHGTHLSDSELKKKFDEADTNKDGVLHPTEFDKPAAAAKKK